jgi:hydroxyacylglutathione hydrolase
MLESQTSNAQTSKIKITAIPAFTDNYIWALQSNSNNTIALVDPGDAEVCLNYIQQHQLTLNSILITHHHPDHVGGIKKLKDYCQQHAWPLTVYGPKHESIPHCDVSLVEDEVVELSELNASFTVIDLPGHTLGHIAYLSDDALFCGDTLFSGGCGRIFEGTAEQMHHSLNKLAALSERTQIYCAHEYTQANLDFALTVEPMNMELVHYYNQVKKLRAENKSTIPSSIAVEKKINPFLRCHIDEVQQSAREYTNTAQSNAEDTKITLTTFAAIRTWKNNF